MGKKMQKFCKYAILTLFIILCFCIFRLTFKNHTKVITFPHINLPNLLDSQSISFPLSTKGTQIVDSFGHRVKLIGVNWSGAHMIRHCVDGLEFRKLSQLCQEIRMFGFNTVRLTFSLQMFYDNNVIDSKYLTANPKLIGMTAMEIFDKTVQELTKAGIMVILNNHVSSSMWCCSQTDGEGLWWTERYPQKKWIECLENFTIRYRDNSKVIAFDIRNEIRRSWMTSPTWGDGVKLTDWRQAATKAANRVLKINPQILVIVGGLNFGIDLSRVIQNPMPQLIVKNKLVYTGHFYGFSWITLSWKLWSYEEFKSKIYDEQLAIQELDVPFYLGQFGTNTQDIPWNYLMRALKESDVDFTYWPLDGFKCQPEIDQTYGIYTNDFRSVRHPGILMDLQSLRE